WRRRARKISLPAKPISPTRPPATSVAAMPKITYIEHDGTQHTVEAALGNTVMETALAQSVPGIVAECGGSCTCAHCLVYVDEAWAERVGARTPEEEDQLDFAFDVKPSSRLSCQIKVTDELAGLVVRTPAYH